MFKNVMKEVRMGIKVHSYFFSRRFKSKQTPTVVHNIPIEVQARIVAAAFAQGTYPRMPKGVDLFK